MRRAAFTLVELLVVIAIIGILAAMLMPTLNRAKSQASKATDLNNLKQIMVATHLYATDSSDVLPPPNWDNGGFPGPQGTNAGWLYTPNMTGSGDRYQIESGLFWSTLKNPKLYVCPSDDLQMSHFSNRDGGIMKRRQRISTYAMNGAMVGYMEMKYPPVKLATLLPTDCAFWETDETEPYYFNDGANYPPEKV